MADNPMDMVSALLQNPDAIKQVGQLLAKASASADAPEAEVHDADDEMPVKAIRQQMESVPDIARIMNAEDNGTRLLQALSPYLSEKRRGNMGQILQAVKIGRVVSAMSKKTGKGE